MKLKIGLLTAGLLVATGATAAGFQWRAESAAWTDVAGTTGASTVESLVTPDYFGFEALKLWDFDSRSCALQLEQSALNVPGPRSMDPVRVCEPKQTQSWQRADVGSGEFVTAISVCTAQVKPQNNAIRGVQLWGSSLDASGKLKPGKAPVKLEFPHCEKWSPRRACPAGSVATGVRLYLADADSGAVGIALGCHAVEVAGK